MPPRLVLPRWRKPVAGSSVLETWLTTALARSIVMPRPEGRGAILHARNVTLPGREPDMTRATTGIAILIAAALACSPAVVAGPGNESPPPIDWRDFVDHDSVGDHVVGEEMCARPR